MKLLLTVAARWLAIPCGSFVDDIAIPEPLYALGPEVPGGKGGAKFPLSSACLLSKLGTWLGAEFSERKFRSWSVLSVCCGNEADFTDLSRSTLIRVRVSNETRMQVHARIVRFLEAGALSPAKAASLSGKCRQPFGFTPVSRSALRPLTERQYGRPAQDGTDSPRTCSRDCVFLPLLPRTRAIPDAIMRCREAKLPPVLVFSDAS